MLTKTHRSLTIKKKESNFIIESFSFFFIKVSQMLCNKQYDEISNKTVTVEKQEKTIALEEKEI